MKTTDKNNLNKSASQEIIEHLNTELKPKTDSAGNPVPSFKDFLTAATPIDSLTSEEVNELYSLYYSEIYSPSKPQHDPFNGYEKELESRIVVLETDKEKLKSRTLIKQKGEYNIDVFYDSATGEPITDPASSLADAKKDLASYKELRKKYSL